MTCPRSSQETAPRRNLVLLMTEVRVSAGVVHEAPTDLREALVADGAALAKWEAITPLARNEWICWIESVKRPETRRNHVERTRTELKEGKRRPCCWPGCPHRTRVVRGGEAAAATPSV